MPLLHLDAEHDLVQSIKLAEQIMGRGSERVRPPRLPLAGERRAAVIAMIERARDTRSCEGLMHSIRVIDSHTGGEPTRLVLEGGPDLGDGPLAERVQRFREHFDDYRCAIVNEPRGLGPLVGALLVKPHRADCAFGVIYFNNVGYLGMCGHGTIGLIASLKFAGKLAAGRHQDRHAGGRGRGGTAARRPHQRGQRGELPLACPASRCNVPGIGRVIGDVAWGGNWFFLISEHNQIIDLTACGCTDRFFLASARGAQCAGPPARRSRRAFWALGSAGCPQPKLRALSRARRTTDRRAAPVPARSSPVSRPTASFSRGLSGCRRV